MAMVLLGIEGNTTLLSKWQNEALPSSYAASNGDIMGTSSEYPDVYIYP